MTLDPDRHSGLLHELMPRFDVVERHRIVVRAPQSTVYAAIRDAELGAAPLTRVLLALRALPAAIIGLLRSRGRESIARPRPARRLRFADFERGGFRVVAERAPDELVIGLTGRFWTPRGGLRTDVSEADFRRGPPAGYALAGWNFTTRPLDDRRTELATETRVWCASDARWKFRIYWFFVRPGSGLIRRAMLRSIRREAERPRRADGAPGTSPSPNDPMRFSGR